MHRNATLPPHQSLALAIALEDEHIRSFRNWALRFRPFDSTLVRLFDRLLTDMEGHKGELLYHASRYLDWHTRLRSPVEAGDDDSGGRFFILSGERAKSVLESALRRKDEAKRFYRYVSILEPRGSLLGGLYNNLGSFQEAHIQLLQEALEHLERKQRWAAAPLPANVSVPAGQDLLRRH